MLAGSVGKTFAAATALQFDETISKILPYYSRLKQISTSCSAILNSSLHF
jgi:hypothetical protein